MMRRQITAGLGALALLGASIASQQTDQQRPPVFRAGANLVQVDAYPSRDGTIVEGLTAADFEILEDGKPQSIEQLEFVRIESNTPNAERVDPNTQAEGNRLAADPRNRVFVIYLDHYHVNLDGSFRTRRPLVDMLNRLLTTRDLFGVMTPLLRPRDLILGRRTQTLEEQLASHWTWGERRTGQSLFLEPEEQAFVMCYGVDEGEALALRRRQERTIEGLNALVSHLGTLREARKVLMLFTSGWRMYQPRQSGIYPPARPGVGVDPGGRLTSKPPPGSADMSRCNSEAQRLYAIDTQYEIRRLLENANRNNVSFYPVNPSGLETPDVTGRGSMAAQWDEIRARWDLLLTLAENTDGIAVGSNDMAAGLRRIADDVSAYYVLSYYSSNPKMDGKYRRIEVKMKPPGLRVKARRGYLAPTPAPETGSAASGTGTPAGPSPVDEALGALSRLRPSAELFSYAVATPNEIAVVVELPADRALTGRWAAGASVDVTVTDASGAAVGTAAAKIDPPSRGQVLRVPIPAGGTGPWTVAARVGEGADSLADRLEVAATRGSLVGDPILFRARPPARAPLQPVADFQFRRSERMHVDWGALGPLDRREARVLGRNGNPLAVPVTVTERDLNGQPTLSIDLNLAPLTEADYLIELMVGRGTESERKLIAFRVIR